MKTNHRLTVVLPFAPDERAAHERLVAAACALQAEGGCSGLDVLQLVPAAGAVPPVGSADAVRWYEVAHPRVAPDSTADTLARLARAALADAAFAADVPRLFVWPAGPLGEECAALMAADLRAASLGRCTGLALQADGVLARRAAFGGRVEVQLLSRERLACAAWRPQGELAPLDPLPAGRVVPIAVSIEAQPEREIEALHSADGQARLEGARLVISGGRGMGGPEGFALLERIAQPLGAAIGGSLPAVDAGWVPVARQVGQSGRFVSPRLYLAVAISGTPQHLAGVASTTRIVAVNQDPEAPIFGVADVGVLADWRELLPLLAQRLAAADGPGAG